MKNLLIILLIGLTSCESGKYIVATSKLSYNIQGQVKFVSEKIVPSLCDSNLITQLDSLSIHSINYRNLYFDKKGTILKWENFDHDSILTSIHSYNYSKSGKFKRLDIFMNGKLKENVKVLHHTKTFLETETFSNETGKLAAVFQIEYNNGLVVKLVVRDSDNNVIQTLNYKLDELGNEIEISREIAGQESKEITILKYLEFDSHRNWTKRIKHNIEFSEDCILETRRIDYYE